MVVSPRAREARAIPRARSELAHLAGLRGLGFGFALDLLTYCFGACSRVFEGVRACSRVFEGVRAF